MTTIEQTHHIQIDRLESPARFVARCTDHQTQAITAGLNYDDAACRFTCDPSEQRFIICSDDGTGPVLTDLGGLRHSVRRWIEDGHYSDVEALKYFRWSGDPGSVLGRTHAAEAHKNRWRARAEKCFQVDR